MVTNFDPIFNPEIEEIQYKRIEAFPMEQEYYLAIYRCNTSNFWHVHGILFDTKEELIKAMKRFDDLANIKILTVILPVMPNGLLV